MRNSGDEFTVLVIGAGGIGCELLKNLVYSGFKNITIVDLDTIDVSNLNRQFLFRKEHVGMSKAKVACESVKAFRDDVNLKAYHANIFSSNFGPEFFDNFDIIFNSLDNQAARRHVNRMCVNIGKAIIESGTSGYLGQVEPILFKGCNRKCNGDELNKEYKACCYECQPRENDRRTYPTCTIRNTPSEPVHCVVWAKFLFNQLFGVPDVDDEDISPDLNDPDGGSDPGALESRVDQSLPKNKSSIWERLTSCNFETVEEVLAWRLFNTDLITLLGMRSLWENRPGRTQPVPITEISIKSATCNPESNGNTFELRDQRKLSLEGWLNLFLTSCRALRKRTGLSNGLTENSHIAINWDKDDADAMDFVAAASAIRAILFHVPGATEQTRFSIKSLAGNIVPAIATTNAIIAGVMVLQGLNILHKRLEMVRTVYLHRQPASFGRFLAPCRPLPANPGCLVCAAGPIRELRLVCVPEHMCLINLRDDVLVKQMGMLAPDVEVDGKGIILISSDEDETKEIEQKTLADFNLSTDHRLRCDDFRQNFTFYLRITNPANLITSSENGTISTETIPSKFTSPTEWKLLGEWEEAKESATIEVANHTDLADRVHLGKRVRREDDEDPDVILFSDDKLEGASPKAKVPRTAVDTEVDDMIMLD